MILEPIHGLIFDKIFRGNHDGIIEEIPRKSCEVILETFGDEIFERILVGTLEATFGEIPKKNFV